MLEYNLQVVRAEINLYCGFKANARMPCNSSFSAVILRCNSYTIQPNHLKCTIQWSLVCSQSCITITIINFRTFPSPPKETMYPLSSHFPHPHPLTQPVARSPLPSSLHGLSSSGHFTHMDLGHVACHVWLLSPSLLSWCPQTGTRVGDAFLFMAASYSVACAHHVSSSRRPLKDFGAVSTFWILGMVLL